MIIELRKLATLLWLSAVFSSLVNGVPQETELKNVYGIQLARMHDANRVEVFNPHRQDQVSVKFSLLAGNGTAGLEQIDQIDPSLFSLKLGGDHLASISVTEIPTESVTEYSFVWHGSSDVGSNVDRELCFSYGASSGHWYAAYQSMNSSWPMDVHKSIAQQHFNYMFDQNRYLISAYNPRPNIKEHIFILEHLFLTSGGFALYLEADSPWFVRRIPQTESSDAALCLSVDNRFPYDSNCTESSYFDIRFRLFASENIRNAVDYVVAKSGLIAGPRTIPNEDLFRHPIWGTQDVYRWPTVNELTYSGLINASSKHLIIGEDGRWSQMRFIDEAGFQLYQKGTIFAVMEHDPRFEMGYQLVGPTLAQNSLNERFSIKSMHYADFSNPETCDLVRVMFTALKYSKQLRLLLLSGFMDLAVPFRLADPTVQKYPNQLTTRYVDTMASVRNLSLISEFGYKTQHLPVLVRLSNYQYTYFEQLLRELIPSALSVSIAGYSFLMPYSAGSHFYNIIPSEEMFIRMLQAVALMPAMSITMNPWYYRQAAIDVALKMIALHEENAPRIIELAHERIQTGRPIIRPMWYHSPEDPKTFTIGDQFMVGEDLVVAPVVVEGQRERQVYLPAGTWLDQHGKSYTGPEEFKVAAPLEELPYFKREKL